jgi:hypothetical protein
MEKETMTDLPTPRSYNAAQVRAAQIAKDIWQRLGSKHRDCTPPEAIMAFAILAKKFDVELKFDKANPRAMQNMLIMLCGGPPPAEWLTALGPSSAPTPDSPSDSESEGSSERSRLHS